MKKDDSRFTIHDSRIDDSRLTTHDISISVRNLSKKYRLFNSPEERFKEALHPFKKKYHKEFWALKDVTFDVPKGSTVGIIGRNGSGKSTLLQIICGVLKPTSGTVTVNSRISALLELGAGFNPELTGRQNVILNGIVQGFSKGEMNAKIPQIREFADIGEFFDQPVKIYSSGMFVRLAFAAAINVDPDILIVDEALAVGDAKFQHKCYNKFLELQKVGKTIAFVTHNSDAIVKYCDWAILLENGYLLKKGMPADVVNSYHEVLYGKSCVETGNPSSVIEPEVTDSYIIPAKTTVESNLCDCNFLSLINMNEEADDHCSARPSYNNNETRIGDRRAIIIDYAVLANGSELDPSTIEYGSQIALYIKILFQADIRNLIVGFAILALDRTYVYHTNTELQRLTPLKGCPGDLVVVKFSWKNLLVGGHYFLNIGCHLNGDNDHKYLDVRRSLAHLHFAETDWCGGLVALPKNFMVCYYGKINRLKA